MEIKTVGVVGAGTMGNGIAHVFAKTGYDIVLVDLDQRLVDRGMQAIARNMEREVSRQKLTADERAQALQRIRASITRRDLSGCDLVVEAATEKFEIKAEIFRDLETICRPEVIFASNTSCTFSTPCR